MAKPVKKKPFQEAIEELLTEYGAKDWCIIARGDNMKILGGDSHEFQAKFWAAGTGDPTKKMSDDVCASLLLADLEFLRAAILDFLLPK